MMKKTEELKIDKAKLEKCTALINYLLKYSKEFMSICNPKFDRGFIGELLVLKQLLETYKDELTSNTKNHIIYYGSSKKDVDMELVLNKKTFQINAKGTKEHDKEGKPKWVRQKARDFVDIDSANGNIVLKENDNKDNFFYAYVDVGMWINKGDLNIFILSYKEALKILGNKYKNKHQGNQSLRKNNSDDMWVEYADLLDYQDDSLERFREIKEESVNLNLSKRRDLGEE